MVINMTRKGV